MSSAAKLLSLRWFQRSIKRACCSTTHHRISASEKTLSAVNINTRIKRKILHKTRITTRNAVSERTVCVSATGPFLVLKRSKMTGRCIENSVYGAHSGKHWKEGPKFAGIAGNQNHVHIRQAFKICSHTASLATVESFSIWVSQLPIPSPRAHKWANPWIIKPPTYPKRLQLISGIVDSGAKKTAKNSFVSMSTTLQVSSRFWCTIVMLILRIVTANSASTD